MEPAMQFAQFKYVLESNGILAGFSKITLGKEDLALHDRQQLKQKTDNLILTNGMLTYGTDLYKWLCSIKPQTVERRTIAISLYNDAHQKVAQWQVQSAFPVKVMGLQLKSTGHEVVIQYIEVEQRGVELVEQI